MESKRKSVKESGNYFQVILKTGKIHPKLYKDPQRAIRAVGVYAIDKLVEVRKELVHAKYTEVDAITDTPEETL